MQQSEKSKPIMISTHTSLAGRDGADVYFSADQTISTHTSLAGRDQRGI